MIWPLPRTGFGFRCQQVAPRLAFNSQFATEPPVEMGREYMAARFPVSIWVYGHAGGSMSEPPEQEFCGIVTVAAINGSSILFERA